MHACAAERLKSRRQGKLGINTELAAASLPDKKRAATASRLVHASQAFSKLPSFYRAGLGMRLAVDIQGPIFNSPCIPPYIPEIRIRFRKLFPKEEETTLNMRPGNHEDLTEALKQDLSWREGTVP